MAANSRFAVATHIMMELAIARPDELKSSSELSRGVNTNPVVIRRILSELQKAGLISTSAGKTGGARLAKKPSSISLLDVYSAVDDGSLFAYNPNDPNKSCELSCLMASLLEPIFDAASRAMEDKLKAYKLSELVDQIHKKCSSKEKKA